MLKTFLCLVINKDTNEELAEYYIDAFDDYIAKHKAKIMFENNRKYIPKLRKVDHWYVDVCQI